jgi:hypothetical protein
MDGDRAGGRKCVVRDRVGPCSRRGFDDRGRGRAGEHVRKPRYTADDICTDKPRHHLAHAIEHHDCHDDGWRVRKDGSRFWANVVITALFGEDGQLAGFAKITRDETDRNQAEQNARRDEQLIDREHLPTELSDTIFRRMFEAGLDLQNALQLITDAEAAERIQHAVEILDGTIRDIRNVVLPRDIDG